MPHIAPLVFVSSTKEDLSEYRLAVQTSFPALDVLYRGMEFFGARPDRAHDVIIRELLECDLYLGIIAHRYGSRDPDTGLSYTEFEYRAARREGMETVVFLIDPSHPVAANSIENDPDAAKKLVAFRATVRRETVVENFTTPEDLVAKVGRSLQKWVDQRNASWQHLLYKPLSEWENNYIRDLYSKDPQVVTHAIDHIHRGDFREGFEHLYGVLHNPDVQPEVAKAIFRQMKFLYDDRRASQIFVNIIADLPHHRALAVNTIGWRSTIDLAQITTEAIDAVFASATEKEATIRWEVAHALPKIAVRNNDRLQECRRLLEQLTTDLDGSVREKAEESLRRLGHRGRRA